MAHRPQPSDDVGGPRDADAGGRPRVALDRVDALIALAVGLASLGIYYFTLAPGLLCAAAGEFQTLAAAPGYAHPAGSPVYVLLARLATLMPSVEVARCVNLLSALMGAAAVGLLYLLGRSLVERRWVSVAGAMALAVSPTFWSQAIVAGVHATAMLFTVAILLAICAWQKTGRSRWLAAAACLTAIGLGVHASVLLVVPGVLLLLLITPRRWIVHWAAAVLGTGAGMAVLLAAFWMIDRASSPACYFRTVIAPSRSVWGLEPEDLDEFHERLRLSLAAPLYRDNFLSKPPEVTRRKGNDYLKNLPREYPPLWLAAAAMGIVWLGRNRGKMALLLAVTLAAHLAFALAYDTPDVHLLYLATYVPVALFAVAGLALVGDVWAALSQRKGKPGHSPEVLSATLGILGLAAVLAPMAYPGAWNEEGRRRCWAPPEAEPFAVEYSLNLHFRVRLLVRDLEDDAVLFTGWSQLYPCYYVAHVEQGRTEMVFVQDYPQPYHFELADSALQYVRRTAPARPVYFTHVVEKVDEEFELEAVRRGRQTLYRVGSPREKTVD